VHSGRSLARQLDPLTPQCFARVAVCCSVLQCVTVCCVSQADLLKRQFYRHHLHLKKKKCSNTNLQIRCVRFQSAFSTFAPLIVSSIVSSSIVTTFSSIVTTFSSIVTQFSSVVTTFTKQGN